MAQVQPGDLFAYPASENFAEALSVVRMRSSPPATLPVLQRHEEVFIQIMSTLVPTDLSSSGHYTRILMVFVCCWQAVENGAVAALVMEGFSSDEQPSVPLIPFADPRDALHRLAAAFYNDPSRRMTVVGVSGAKACTHVFFKESKI